MKYSIKKIVNPILFIFGLLLCIFVAVFLITGMDEIWNGYTLWLFGVGIAGFLGSIGISSIIISLSKKKRAPRVFFILSIIFFLVIIIDFLNS